MRFPIRLSPGRSAAVLVLAGALVFLGACAGTGPAPGRAPRDGTVVLGSISDVDSFNEYLSRQDFAGKVLRRIYLRLARESGSGAFEPVLAESWKSSEDGRSLTFRLRRASWSDGRPITARDVRFTWQAQTAPEVAWVGSASKHRITDVEVVDDRTVTFRFDGRYPDQLADAVEGGILAEHVHGAVPFEEWRSHDWSKLSFGSGPFLLERYRPGEEIALRRNERYFRDGLPRVDRVVIRVVPDADSLLAQVLAGDIDYFEGIAPRDAHRLSSGSGVSLVSFDYPKYDYIGWNGSRPPFDDPLVRRALTLAIDRQALVEDLLYGFGRVSKGPVPSFLRGADASIEPWPYDPGEARRILADRGYATRGEDGVTGPGRPLRFELVTNAGNRLREAMAVKIQEQLSRIGVGVELRTLEMGTLVARCMHGDYDAYLGGWTVFGKLDLESIFGSDSTPPNGSNVVFYGSSEVDRLLRELDRAADWTQMKPLLDEVQRRIHEEQPYTFLYETKRVAVVGPRLSGLRIDDPADPLARLERCRLNAS